MPPSSPPIGRGAMGSNAHLQPQAFTPRHVGRQTRRRALPLPGDGCSSPLPRARRWPRLSAWNPRSPHRPVKGPPRTSAPASLRPSEDPGDQVLVVGYDGSPGSRETIAKAARRCDSGGRLVIVRTLDSGFGEPPTRADCGAYQRAVTSLLIAVRSELYPHVPYELRVVAGDLSSALADVVRRHHGAELVTGSPPSPLEGRPNPRTGAPLSRRPARASVDKSHGQRRDQAHRADTVEQSGLDSFPASDPPSWWAGPGASTSEHP